MEIVSYKGWKNNLRLANGDVEVIVTLDVGPRVISYALPGGMNVMKNYPEMMGGVGEDEWQIRGGMRFWLGPEDLTRTYFPDNASVQHAMIGPGQVRLTPPPETEYGVQKEMELTLGQSGTQLKITLRVTNIGDTVTDLCPWGPTVMAPGGIEIIPLPPHFDHPGHPSRAKSPADFAPNQSMAIWPYTDFTDARWQFGSRYIRLNQDAKKGPTKIGFAHRCGWVGYWNAGNLFVMKFPYLEGATYPDLGGNYQTFSNEDMLEMEPIGAHATLEPGHSAELHVTWELFGNVPAFQTEDDIDRIIRPLITY